MVHDALALRRLYGAFPTGVTSVAALVDGKPVGLAASSFTSVSLEPPLVSVCIAHTSNTWPVIRTAPTIGVSVLAAHQSTQGRALAERGIDRFADIDWRASPSGSVFVNGASAWLDTKLENEVRAGDHDIVLLRVVEFDVEPESPPLVFHGSRFRRLEA